jgi:radical SAM superfamily enzyme YgiQ (UPF0313 family)
MRVLLVRPPHHNPRLGGFMAMEPLSLESVAGAAAGHEVRLLDMQLDRGLDRELDRFRPDLVGTGGCTADVPGTRRVLARVKQRAPTAFTVVGGQHASVAPGDFNHPDVDAVVVGMGEPTFGELLRALERGEPLQDVAGLALPAPGGLRRTAERPLPPDLDGLPTPRRDLTRRYRWRYRAFGQAVGLLNTARGCPFKCRFCSIIRLMGGRYLVKRADRVVAELSQMPQRYIRLADGNTFATRRRMRELHDAIHAAGLNKRFMVDVRADTVARRPDLIARWREIGLYLAAVGLESIRPEQLRRLNKGGTVDDNVQALRILRDNEIRVLGQFMIDPEFTEDDFERLLDFVQEQRIQLPSFLIMTPFPGTPIHDEMRDRLCSGDLSQFDCFHAVLPTRLPLEQFYRRFLGLYDASYGTERLARAVRARLSRRGDGELPLLSLAAARLFLVLNRRNLLREYGLA